MKPQVGVVAAVGMDVAVVVVVGPAGEGHAQERRRWSAVQHHCRAQWTWFHAAGPGPAGAARGQEKGRMENPAAGKGTPS